ncbi:hypothetical protein ACQJBY_002530 [Aegilops geniculata]
MLAGRGPLLPSPARVSHSLSVPVLFLFFLNLGLGFASSPSRYLDPPLADREDIDIVIEDVAKDATAEVEKIATEEAAKDAAEGAAKGSAGEPDKAAAEEAGKGPVGEAGKAATEEEVVDDEPSSSTASGSGRCLKVSDDLFVHLPGTASTGAPVEGEVFDDEVLAATGLEVVDEPSAGGGGSQEEQLLRAMSANFQKLQTLHRARLDKAKSRMAVVDKAEADLEGHVAEAQAWFHQAHKDLKAAQDVLAERDLALVMKQADIEKAQELAKQEAA